MSPTSEPRRPTPRLRARAKAVPPSGLRPEVADALGGLERSIGEVTDWEHALATSAEGGAGAAPAEPPEPSDVVLVARVQPNAEEEVPVSPEPEPPIVAQGRSARRRLRAADTPPPAVPPPLELGDLGLEASARAVSTADDPTLDVSAIAAGGGAPADEPRPDLDLSGLGAATAAGEADPMATWVESTSSPHRFGPDPDQVRRRRNGRILSWAGAIVLVAVAAWLLIPDHSPARPTLVPSQSTTSTTEATTTTAQLGSQFTVPTLPPTSVPSPLITTPTTVKKKATPTTARPTTTTTARATTTTQATTTTTAPPPPPTTTPTTMPPTCVSVPGQVYDGC